MQRHVHCVICGVRIAECDIRCEYCRSKDEHCNYNQIRKRRCSEHFQDNIFPSVEQKIDEISKNIKDIK